MIAILLASLGIPFWLVIALVLLLLSRRRWVRSRPGAFTCAIRRTAGEVPGMGEKWSHGYALWVRDVLAFRANRTLFRESLLMVDGIGSAGIRRASPGEVSRLGSEPSIIPLQIAGGGAVEVAVRAEDHALAIGPFDEEMVGGREPAEREPAPADISTRPA